MHALVAEAMKKAAICWVTVAPGPAYPLWCLGVEDALYVVVGGDEQPAPGLVEATGGGAVTVGARGDHGGRIVTWPVAATRVEPGSEVWESVAPQLAAKRLNASGTSDALVAKWVDGATVIKLMPGDAASVDSATADATAERAGPRESPATRRTAKPFRLHKVKRRPD
jgi:hypothetical protein